MSRDEKRFRRDSRYATQSSLLIVGGQVCLVVAVTRFPRAAMCARTTACAAGVRRLGVAVVGDRGARAILARDAAGGADGRRRSDG